MYDNPYWEYHLPVNPPGAYLAEGDVMLYDIELENWVTDTGFEFRPRLRDNVEWVNRVGLATSDDELDYDYDEFDCG